MERILEQRVKHFAPFNSKKKPASSEDDGSELSEPTPVLDDTLETLINLENQGEGGRARRARLDAMGRAPDDLFYLRKESDEEAYKRYSAYREQRPPGGEHHGWYAVVCIRLDPDCAWVRETGLDFLCCVGCRSSPTHRTT